jgi:biopolymer transport protein ExbD
VIRPLTPRRRRDTTIALINVVFLMLIFFLIAGTIAPALDPDLQLAETAGLEGREPPDALVLHADGSLSFRGMPSDPAAFMAAQETAAVRIVPDRNVPAPRLIEVAGSLRRLGASDIFLVTERAIE